MIVFNKYIDSIIPVCDLLIDLETFPSLASVEKATF